MLGFPRQKECIRIMPIATPNHTRLFLGVVSPRSRKGNYIDRFCELFSVKCHFWGDQPESCKPRYSNSSSKTWVLRGCRFYGQGFEQAPCEDRDNREKSDGTATLHCSNGGNDSGISHVFRMILDWKLTLPSPHDTVSHSLPPGPRTACSNHCRWYGANTSAGTPPSV